MELFKNTGTPAGVCIRGVYMHSRFFRYRIYRRRFTVAVLLVFLFSFLLLAGILLFFVNTWASQQQEEAKKSFNNIVARVETEEEYAEEYVWDVYSSLPLMEDAESFFAAKNEKEYIYLRSLQSLTSPNYIRSFPQYLRSCLMRRDGYMWGVSVFPEHGTSKYLMVDSSGNMEVYYGDTGVGYFSENGWNAGEYSVRVTGSSNQVLGSIRFWTHGDQVFSASNSYVGSCGVIDQSDKIWGLSSPSPEEDIPVMRKALECTMPTGSFFYEGRWVFYSWNEAPSHTFWYVSVVNVGQLLNANRDMVWLLALAILLLDLSVIMFIYWSMHYDSVFLGHLLGIIERVERGDFKAVETMARPSFQGKNEYSLISEALENMSRALDEYILNEYRLKIKQQETAMMAMQHQINPHFLYNTLEAIRAKALMEKNPMTAEAIALLGDLYRDMVRKESLVFFWEERDLLKTYLQIMMLRYPDSFAYQITLDPALLEMKTPKFWLQPLAENFFSHGFDQESEYNVLVVTGEAEGDGWRIEMIDNGYGIPEDKLSEVNEKMRSGEETPGASIGLRNVYIRLAYYYGKQFSMEVKSNPEGGTCISVYIPNKEASDVHPVDS